MDYNFMKISVIFITLSQPLCAVIPDGALVKTNAGIKSMRDLAVGEEVLSADSAHTALANMRIAGKQPRSRRNSTIKIDTHDGTIFAAPDQVLFDPSSSEWVKAEDLTFKNSLLNENMQAVSIYGVVRQSNNPLLTTAVQVEVTRQLYVDGFLNHNMDVVKAIGVGFVNGVRSVATKEVAKKVAKEAMKEAGKELVKMGTRKAVEAIADSMGAVEDNGRDGNGAGWRADSNQNVRINMDLNDAVWNLSDEEILAPYRRGVSSTPTVNVKEAPAYAPGVVQAGNQPATVIMNDGKEIDLAPGDAYSYGFAPVESVEYRRPAAAPKKAEPKKEVKQERVVVNPAQGPAKPAPYVPVYRPSGSRAINMELAKYGLPPMSEQDYSKAADEFYSRN